MYCRYVRETFELALPHPSTITGWYSSLHREPGFSGIFIQIFDAIYTVIDILFALLQMSALTHLRRDKGKSNRKVVLCTLP